VSFGKVPFHGSLEIIKGDGNYRARRIEQGNGAAPLPHKTLQSVEDHNGRTDQDTLRLVARNIAPKLRQNRFKYRATAGELSGVSLSW
jgi:hypothetical protein